MRLCVLRGMNDGRICILSVQQVPPGILSIPEPVRVLQCGPPVFTMTQVPHVYQLTRSDKLGWNEMPGLISNRSQYTLVRESAY